MRIAILGFGREGKSVLKFLKKSPSYRKAQIEILDQKLDKSYLKHFQRFDLIFRSPGVPYNLPEIKTAIKKGVEFSSGTKLFFDLCRSPIIGITGTKGKGTTSTLLYQILKKSLPAHAYRQAGDRQVVKKVLLAGNIGKPALEILPKTNSKTLVILELSSFQLQDLKKSPTIAVVVDTFPDHLDVHKNIKEYLNAKANIARYQNPADAVFYFSDNAWSAKIAGKSRGKKIGIVGNPFGLKKNQVMAATIAAYLGCPKDKIMAAVKNFKGVEHRLELVTEKNGVRFYNDSASTNPQTTAAAILNFQNQIILIAGGKDKNLDYQPLAEAIKKSGQVKLVVLIGENKNKIKKLLPRGVAILISENLKSAVKLAHKNSKSGDVILFSPGAASFDMFKDYADRGNQYKKAVFAIKRHTAN